MKTLDQSRQPLLGDADGLYMANHPKAAVWLAERLKNYNLVELCCGIGGTTIYLAQTAKMVTAVDGNESRIQFARQNCRARGILQKVRFVLGNVLDEELLRTLEGDVVFADPDWSPVGRPKSRHTVNLSEMQPPGDQLIHIVRKCISPNVVLRLPSVVDLGQMNQFGRFEAVAIHIDGHLSFYYIFFGDPISRLCTTHIGFNTDKPTANDKTRSTVI